MDHLVVFARWPEPGRVKAGLTPALPPELACELAERMLRDTLEAGRAAPADRRWLYWVDAPLDRPWSQDARERGYRESLQRGRDLGARLESAFDELLHDRKDRVVVIAADVPEITPAIVGGAFGRLASYDLVLGPAGDGGCYLTGLARRSPELFRDLREAPLAAWRARAGGLGLSVALVEPLEVVESAADLVALAVRCRDRANAPRHTRAALQQYGLIPRD